MLEYSLSLEPEIESQINAYIEELNTVTKVKKMNRLLYKCKELVMRLKYHSSDPHHQFLYKALIQFGIP
jgi:hypothetical protein